MNIFDLIRRPPANIERAKQKDTDTMSNNTVYSTDLLGTLKTIERKTKAKIVVHQLIGKAVADSPVNHATIEMLKTQIHKIGVKKLRHVYIERSNSSRSTSWDGRKHNKYYYSVTKIVMPQNLCDLDPKESASQIANSIVTSLCENILKSQSSRVGIYWANKDGKLTKKTVGPRLNLAFEAGYSSNPDQSILNLDLGVFRAVKMSTGAALDLGKTHALMTIQPKKLLSAESLADLIISTVANIDDHFIVTVQLKNKTTMIEYNHRAGSA